MRSEPVEMIMLLLLLVFVVEALGQSQPVLSGLVAEAQCRAGCLAEWSQPGQEREECWAPPASLAPSTGSVDWRAGFRQNIKRT